jgi:hypothetical protein
MISALTSRNCLEHASIPDEIAGSVSINIVTGDNERVTQLVYEELGVLITRILTGKQVTANNDDALGLTPLPLAYFILLAALLAGYLRMVQAGKQWFYRTSLRD